MKKANILLIGFLIAICFVACKKETLNTGNATLEASKTSSIKKGEPVIFTLPPSAAGSSAKWSVNPSSNTQINARGDSASILFGSKGNYTVTATFGNSMATSSVSVTDTAYTDSIFIPQVTLPLMPGEVMKIEVFKYLITLLDSSHSAYLRLQDQTTNSYPPGSVLTSQIAGDSTGYTITFDGVWVPGYYITVDGVRLPGLYGNVITGAYGWSSLYPISEGTSKLTIIVNGKTYSGTIIKTGTNFTIDWPDTTAVIISPTSL